MEVHGVEGAGVLVSPAAEQELFAHGPMGDIRDRDECASPGARERARCLENARRLFQALEHVEEAQHVVCSAPVARPPGRRCLDGFDDHVAVQGTGLLGVGVGLDAVNDRVSLARKERADETGPRPDVEDGRAVRTPFE